MSTAIEFHPLTVTVRPETDDSVRVTFDVPHHLRSTFGHLPGQHLVLRTELDGVDVRRSYSICTAPGSGTMSVGIKAIPDGAFSTWATTTLADGDTVEVMAPIGEFIHRVDPGAAGNYVALAAGSGITPILSIVAAILEGEPASRITLVYGNRAIRSIMFLEELEGLKNRFPDRFQLINILSRETSDIELFNGRIDDDKLRLLTRTLIPATAVDTWYVCGPLDMVEAVQRTLTDLGVDDGRIRSELFYDQRIETPPPSVGNGSDAITLRFTLGGRTSEVTVGAEGPSLLDYARTVRPEVPFACKGGMCASCKARVIEGEATMTRNYALTEDDLTAGYILTCQAHPRGHDVAITYDLS
jgi:ring-1,2-phenylacetyl-CoA epoxidase subunit PaaE